MAKGLVVWVMGLLLLRVEANATNFNIGNRWLMR